MALALLAEVAELSASTAPKPLLVMPAGRSLATRECRGCPIIDANVRAGVESEIKPLPTPTRVLAPPITTPAVANNINVYFFSKSLARGDQVIVHTQSAIQRVQLVADIAPNQAITVMLNRGDTVYSIYRVPKRFVACHRINMKPGATKITPKRPSLREKAGKVVAAAAIN